MKPPRASHVEGLDPSGTRAAINRRLDGSGLIEGAAVRVSEDPERDRPCSSKAQLTASGPCVPDATSPTDPSNHSVAPYPLPTQALLDELPPSGHQHAPGQVGCGGIITGGAGGRRAPPGWSDCPLLVDGKVPESVAELGDRYLLRFSELQPSGGRRPSSSWSKAREADLPLQFVSRVALTAQIRDVSR